jgi:hypothetical protein
MSCVLHLCAAGSRAARAQRPRRAHAVPIGRKLEIAAAATAKIFPAHKAAAQWRVTPNLPSGITIDAANGNITGNPIDSGGAHPEITSYSIRAASADGTVTAKHLPVPSHRLQMSLRHVGVRLGQSH